MTLGANSYGNGPEVRLHDGGTLDEVCTPTAHLEQLDTGHWFLEVEVGGKSVAVWLYSTHRISATYERRNVSTATKREGTK